jgi:hypothetical protein
MKRIILAVASLGALALLVSMQQDIRRYLRMRAM